MHYLKNELYELNQNDPAIFEFLQAGSLDGIWYWDVESPEHEWMSPNFWKLLGFDAKDKKHLASEWQDLINPDDLKTALHNFEMHCKDPSHPYDQIVRYTHRDGSTVWVRCRGIAIRDESGKAVRMLGAHNDLTELKTAQLELQLRTDELQRLYEEVKELSLHDSMTNLLNRRAFQEQMEWMIKSSIRRNEYLSVLLIDADHFKQINDQYGHAQGDKALVAISSALQATARESDIVARYGGEEFVLAAPDTNENQSLLIAERVRKAIESIDYTTTKVTVSVGIATFKVDAPIPKESRLYKDLIEEADQALYAAKQNGRNQVFHFNSASLR